MFLIDFASQSASTFAEIYLIYYFNTQYNPQKLYFSVMCSCDNNDDGPFRVPYNLISSFY